MKIEVGSCWAATGQLHYGTAWYHVVLVGATCRGPWTGFACCAATVEATPVTPAREPCPCPPQDDGLRKLQRQAERLEGLLRQHPLAGAPDLPRRLDLLLQKQVRLCGFGSGRRSAGQQLDGSGGGRCLPTRAWL